MFKKFLHTIKNINQMKEQNAMFENTHNRIAHHILTKENTFTNKKITK